MTARLFDVQRHYPTAEGYTPSLAEVNFQAMREAFLDTGAVNFVLESVTRSYLRVFPQAHHEELQVMVAQTLRTFEEAVTSGDIKNSADLQQYTTAIHNGLYGNGLADHWFKSAYAEYKAGSKANHEEELITGLTADLELETPHPRVLDFGAGSGALSARLGLSGRRHVTAIDVINYLDTSLPGMENVHFQIMTDPRVIPYEGGEFDIVIAKTVLHHVDGAIQMDVMEELQRVLRPGGLLLIEEDLYGVRPEHTGYHEAFAEQDTFRDFVTLPHMAQKNALAILDHHANGTVLGGKGMVLPCSYASPDEWDKKFAQAGLQPHTWHITGFPLYRAHANCQGWATYKK